MRLTQSTRVVAAALAAATTLLLVGCTTPAPAPEPPPVTGDDGDYAPDHSSEQWAANMMGCLEDAGFVVTLRPDGGINYTSKTETEANAYSEAKDTCSAQFGYDKPLRPLSRDEVSEQYASLVELAECLRGEGLDPGPTPSEQTFVDGYLSSTFSWDPYGEVASPPNAQVSEDEYFALLKVCPRP